VLRHLGADRLVGGRRLAGHAVDLAAHLEHGALQRSGALGDVGESLLLAGEHLVSDRLQLAHVARGAPRLELGDALAGLVAEGRQLADQFLDLPVGPGEGLAPGLDLA